MQKSLFITRDGANITRNIKPHHCQFVVISHTLMRRLVAQYVKCRCYVLNAFERRRCEGRFYANRTEHADAWVINCAAHTRAVNYPDTVDKAHTCG